MLVVALALWQYYRMYLSRKSEEELTGMEAYLRGLMQKQSISYFPIRRALCLPTETKDDEAIQEVGQQVGELQQQVRELQDGLSAALQAQFASLNERMAKLAGGVGPAAASSAAGPAMPTTSTTPEK